MKTKATKITPFTKEQMALMDKNRAMKSRSAHADHSDTPPLPGNIRLQRGDLIRSSGIYFMVVMANPSRALIVATEGREVQVVNRVTGEQQASFTAPGKDESISRDLPKESLVARLGETGFMEFLGGLSVLRRRALGLDAIIINETKGQDSMKTPDELPKGGLVAEAIRANGGKTKTTKAKKEKKAKEDTGAAVGKKKLARGGLAAEAIRAGAGNAKPKRTRKAKTQSNGEAKPPGEGRMPKIMEHSVCAVVRKLGAAGVGIGHAKAILATFGVTMPPASLSVQLGFGRSGKRPAAELTKAQVKELKALAPEPEAIAKTE